MPSVEGKAWSVLKRENRRLTETREYQKIASFQRFLLKDNSPYAIAVSRSMIIMFMSVADEPLTLIPKKKTL